VAGLEIGDVEIDGGCCFEESGFPGIRAKVDVGDSAGRSVNDGGAGDCLPTARLETDSISVFPSPISPSPRMIPYN
jgi:hypothetical protein